MKKLSYKDIQKIINFLENYDIEPDSPDGYIICGEEVIKNDRK